jgi:hypothetical protein
MRRPLVGGLVVVGIGVIAQWHQRFRNQLFISLATVSAQPRAEPIRRTAYCWISILAAP